MADPADPITLSSDSEAEDLRKAIALSLQDVSTTRGNQSGHHEEDSTYNAHHQVQPVVSQSGLATLNRKQMEEERLERLAKRRINTGSDQSETPPPKKKKVAAEEPLNRAQVTDSAGTSSSSPAPSLRFTKPVVKRTWAYGFPRTSKDIKIEEVLDRKNLQLAVLSSFQWDEDWLLSKIDVSKTKLMLLAFAANHAQKQAMQDNAPSGTRFVFPPMNGPGSMHSKLQLLKYHSHLRVVIPTGNLVPYDWGESGVMENMVFLVDLPRLANSNEHKPTSFSNELGRFLAASGVDDKMVASLRNYDFSATEDLGFVYSIPGSHSSEESHSIGHCGLGTCVAGLGLQTGGPIQVDLVCSSLGSLKIEYVEAIYRACQGHDGSNEGEDTNGGIKISTDAALPEPLCDRFRIYFPSDQTIRNSRGGEGAGGTICAQARWWRSPSFPRQLVRDCLNRREGLLMHSKVIYVRHHSQSTTTSASNKSGPGAFAYVGSANLSESAWGRIVKDRKTGTRRITCRNWECGVVIPSRHMAVGATLDAFETIVPVPVQYPSPAYGPGQEPWFFLGAD